jgi:hypothetical protein
MFLQFDMCGLLQQCFSTHIQAVLLGIFRIRWYCVDTRFFLLAFLCRILHSLTSNRLSKTYGKLLLGAKHDEHGLHKCIFHTTNDRNRQNWRKALREHLAEAHPGKEVRQLLGLKSAAMQCLLALVCQLQK